MLELPQFGKDFECLLEVGLPVLSGGWQVAQAGKELLRAVDEEVEFWVRLVVRVRVRLELG